MFQMMLYTVMNACMLDVVRKKGGPVVYGWWLFFLSQEDSPLAFIYIYHVIVFILVYR